jgi:hypothetical protein
VYTSTTEQSLSTADLYNLKQLTTAEVSAVFDVSSLQWLRGDANDRSVALFVAYRFVEPLLHGVVRSFVALETSIDFATGKGLYPVDGGDVDAQLFYSGSRETTVYFASLNYVRRIIQHAGTAVLRKCLVAHASDLSKCIIAKPKADSIPPERVAVDTDNVTTGKITYQRLLEQKDHILDSDEEQEGWCTHIEGLPDIPHKARLTFFDLVGIDLSGIDPRVMPKRPYITACKVWSSVYDTYSATD